MSWRTVVISSRAKLDYKMEYLVVRTEEATSRIHLGEIAVLMIESTAVSLTAYLLSELCKHKIRVIFCDEGRDPQAELHPYYGSHDQSRRIKEQMGWDSEIKQQVWAEIVRAKIAGQRANLPPEAVQARERLMSYLSAVTPGDQTNREGHAAKVYFNALFGMDFSRSDENAINAALNYGYGILLSAFNREVVSCGYLTELGIFHDNTFNRFNFSCDLMEPFRPFVDRLVLQLRPDKLEHEEKMRILNVLNMPVRIHHTEQLLLSAIRIYTHSVVHALRERDVEEMHNPVYE